MNYFAVCPYQFRWPTATQIIKQRICHEITLCGDFDCFPLIYFVVGVGRYEKRLDLKGIECHDKKKIENNTL